jgi:carboxyl-terminal processing protease
LNSYSVGNDAIQQLRALAEKKGVQWNDAQFTSDERIIKTYIKAQIARSVWNTNEQVAVSIYNDKQVQKALQLFPEVKRLAQAK